MAVAWSGGVDSTALLLALKHSGYDVHAWHIDHGWHSSSADDAKWLQKQAEAWAIPYDSVRLQLANSSNREAEARHGRYEALYQLSKKHGVDALCLAHHRDDQAETICLRMLQGAGVGGCQGMAPIRQWRDIRLFRPFLHLPKQTLVDALTALNVHWLEDRSNSDTTLWRNHIRYALFPAMEINGARPTELFLRWGGQAKRLTDQISDQARMVPISSEDSMVWVDWSSWYQQSHPVRVCLLQRMVSALLGEGVVMGRRHILAIDRWLDEGANGGLDLSRSRLMRKDGHLLLTKSK